MNPFRERPITEDSYASAWLDQRRRRWVYRATIIVTILCIPVAGFVAHREGMFGSLRFIGVLMCVRFASIAYLKRFKCPECGENFGVYNRCEECSTPVGTPSRDALARRR